MSFLARLFGKQKRVPVAAVPPPPGTTVGGVSKAGVSVVDAIRDEQERHNRSLAAAFGLLDRSGPEKAYSLRGRLFPAPERGNVSEPPRFMRVGTVDEKRVRSLYVDVLRAFHKQERSPEMPVTVAGKAARLAAEYPRSFQLGSLSDKGSREVIAIADPANSGRWVYNLHASEIVTSAARQAQESRQMVPYALTAEGPVDALVAGRGQIAV